MAEWVKSIFRRNYDKILKKETALLGRLLQINKQNLKSTYFVKINTNENKQCFFSGVFPVFMSNKNSPDIVT
jgi:hypothetical protein